MNCPNCQTQNPDHANFCMSCGKKLNNEMAAGENQNDAKSQFNTDRYLPSELVTKLEAARANKAMLGERRVITMLFCDVKGSTAAAEKVDPETWTDIMNGIFEHMIRPIYKYEGLVPRLMGDAILAFFGAPITHEDDPQRAVLAGLEIQEGIKTYAEDVRLNHELEFGLRVGINTGLVVVGEIGSDLRMEYTAIGDAINLAARMEQTAAVGTVQISEDTYKLVAPFFEFESLGQVEIKGKAEPIQTYRVLKPKANPGRTRGLDGLSSPLVGREAQLTLLHERLNQLKSGTGSILSIVGEAGLGKSTLVSEMKKSSEGLFINWVKGDAFSYAHSISYFPWRQIIRQAINAHEADSPEQVRGKLQYGCECCALPGGDIPFLEAMLAVESEGSLQVVAGYQGEALIGRIIEATRGFLCGVAREAPLIIVFDDLHWADEASLSLLASLANLIQSQPILFVCILRPDRTAASWESMNKLQREMPQNYFHILLEPLRAEQTDTLLENLLGIKDLPKHIRDLIVEKADGNPFFIEEIIRTLIETNQIVREGNHWRAVSTEAKISLPNTLRGVLNARIDRLPELTKNVLQNAAVIGRSFDLRVLKKLTDLNGGLDAHIQHLAEASLIEPGKEECTFRHVLIQEAAYESILIKMRAQLHKRIAESLEEIQAQRIEEFAPLLAYHFYMAKDARSLKYDELAGEKASRLYANAEAATHFNRALEVAKREHEDIEHISRLFARLGSVYELSGRFEQALTTYDEMGTFGGEGGIRQIEMQALMAKATIYSIFSQLHDSAKSEQMLIEALEISREIGDRATQAKLNWNLMLTFLFSKRLDRALEYGKVALTLARESGDREQLAFVLNDSCRLYTCRGEFEKAHACIREARELWRALDHQVMLADSFGAEAEAYFNNGEFKQSLECSQQALAICEQTNNLWGQAYDLMLISFVHFHDGQAGKGIQTAERSNHLADESGLIASSITMRSELAWVYAFCGDFEKGFELVELAMQFAETKQPAWKSFPQAAKVRIHLLQNDIQAAEQITNGALLQPTSIPYARYTVFVCLANIELAIAKKEYEHALKLIQELLDEVTPLIRIDICEVLNWKGLALMKLGRLEEAHQDLTQACSLARDTDSVFQLWSCLSTLAEVESKLDQGKEAERHRAEARGFVEQIADSLREVGLRDSFLNQPQVKALNA